MQESLTYKTHRRRVEDLRESIETWQEKHGEALLAFRVDDLVESAVLAAAETHRVWSLARKEMLAARSGATVRAVTQDILHHLAYTAGVLSEMEKLARHFAEDTGYRIERLEELPAAIEGVRDLRDRIARAVPPAPPSPRGPNPERVRQSREEIGRGEGMGLGQLAERVKQGGAVEFG